MRSRGFVGLFGVSKPAQKFQYACHSLPDLGNNLTGLGELMSLAVDMDLPFTVKFDQGGRDMRIPNLCSVDYCTSPGLWWSDAVTNSLAGVTLIRRIRRQQPQQVMRSRSHETAKTTPTKGKSCSWASISDVSRPLGICTTTHLAAGSSSQGFALLGCFTWKCLRTRTL